ncbi:MAG: hypothetical protein F7O42_00590 [Opitutae bacterium]|nr:hypothetical protein [Opitutae bacterium]
MNVIDKLSLAFSLILPVTVSITEAAAQLARMPVVEWTVRDAPDFRYHFLENVRTTELWYATPETGTFSHHGFLTYHQGILFACWDSQARDENTSGQRSIFRYSNDDGETWSDPKVLFPPLADNVPASETEQPNPFQTSQGFARIEDRLYAVTCADRELEEKVYRFNEVSRVRIGFLAREVRTDGTLGEIFWLSDTAPEPEPGYPARPAGDPSLVDKISAYFKEPANLPQLLFGPRQYPDSDDEHRMNEPSPPWQLADGTWVRFYRDGGSIHTQSRAEVDASRPRRNYVSFSFDGGNKWTIPTRTNFPDSVARTNAGKLPDGQVYVINNILPMTPRQGGRSMLAISLSRDGLNFDRMAVIKFIPPPRRYEGKFKGAGYQYPHSVVVRDNLWVIYSVNKEDMEVVRIPLSELYSLGRSSLKSVDPKPGYFNPASIP